MPIGTYCDEFATNLKRIKNRCIHKDSVQGHVPSDRLPNDITNRPNGFVLNTNASNKFGSRLFAMYLTPDGK